MADTLSNVPLPKGGQWVDLYAATSIPVGTALEIHSINAVGVNIAISATKPSDDSGYETIKTESANYIVADSSGAWARSMGGTSINVAVYDPSKAPVQTISSIEAAIEKGFGFSLTIEVDVITGATNYYVLRTPADKVVRVKSRSITTGGGLRYEPMVGGTFTLGADITSTYLRNMNGIIGGPPATSMFIANVTADGTPIDVVRTPKAQGTAGNPVTYASPGSERILAKSTDYLLKFDNIDNADIWCIYSLILTETDT